MTAKVVVRCDLALVDETDCDVDGNMTPRQLVKEWLDGFLMRPEPFQHGTYLTAVYDKKSNPLVLRIRLDHDERFALEVDIGEVVTEALDHVDDGLPACGLRAFEKAMRELLDRVVARVEKPEGDQ